LEFTPTGTWERMGGIMSESLESLLPQIGGNVPRLWHLIWEHNSDLRTHADMDSPNSIAYCNWTRSCGMRELHGRVVGLELDEEADTQYQRLCTLMNQTPEKIKVIENAKPSGKKSIALVYNSKDQCGIAQHTEYWVNHLHTSFIKINYQPDSNSYPDILRQCRVHGISIVHFQHEFALFPNQDAFTELLMALKKDSRKIIIEFHSVSSMYLDRQREYTELADVVILHHATDDLSGYGAEIKLIDLALPEKEARLASFRARHKYIVALFGFPVDHKRFPSLIKEIASVKKKKLGLLMITPYDKEVPNKDVADMEKEINETGLMEHTLWINEFLPIEEVISTLKYADITYFNYDPEVGQGSASGAAAIALLAGRVIVNESSMYEDLPVEFRGDKTWRDIILKGYKAKGKRHHYKAWKKVAKLMDTRASSNVASGYDQIYIQLLTKEGKVNG